VTGDSRDPTREHPEAPHEHGHSLYEAGEFLDAPPTEEIAEREVSLRSRVLNVRTIASVVFGVALLYLLFRFVLNLDFAATWERIVNADVGYLGIAFVAYYLTFPLRGYRWAYVLGKVGTRVRFRDATEILFLSWFVNCLVPAKLGDLYRAWLLKGNYGASISRSVGTIFIERIADLLVIFALALAAGYWSFRNLSRPEVNALFLAGFVLAAVLLLVVIGLRWWGHRVTGFLPVRAREFYQRFHEGSTAAVTTRSIPTIVVLTGMIWILEGLRLYFVILALDLPTVNLGISSAIFVTLAGSLLTAIPLTPAGVGFVEAGIVGALSLYGIAAEPAAAVALTDRAISILTVIVLGGIAYALSKKVRRAHGLGAEPAPSG
jgi:glycosyltransferase 2 family protein